MILKSTLPLILSSLCFFAPPTRAAAPITPDDVSEPSQWGATHVTNLKHLRFAGQPNLETLTHAKSDGVTLIIDLRDPSEQDWPEATVAAQQDLLYQNVPVPKNAPFSTEAFEKIESLIAENKSGNILIHCSSGNRAGAWLATHLVTRHKMTLSEAMAVARKAGISKDEIASKVEQYLNAPHAEDDK